MDILLQQIINGLVQGSVYALVALGYTMVYGILGLINFAHGEVVMVGAMVALTVLQILLSATVSPVLALLLSLIVAIVACMALGCAGLLKAMMAIDPTITFTGVVLTPVPPVPKPIDVPPAEPVNGWLVLLSKFLALFRR